MSLLDGFLPWLVIGVLVAVNALYVAAEFAAVAVQRSALDQMIRDGHRRARAVLSVLKDGKELDRYIAASQIGITLSSLVVGAYGQATIAVAMTPVIERTLGLSMYAAESTAAVAVLVALTVLQVLFGELLPKSLALQFPGRVALATYLPMRWSVWVYRGFIWLLNGSGALLLRPFGIRGGGHVHVHSPGEIGLLLAESRRHGTLTPEAHRRLERGLHLSSRLVRQLMVPRSELAAIEASTPPAEIIRRLLESPYSLHPVYVETLDQVLGTVNTKDVVGVYATRGQIPPLEQLLRPIPFVPAHLTADRLVRFLQEKRASKAMVVDEFGGIEGIVSIDDVLGELFGGLGDELEEREAGASTLPDGRVRLRGSMTPLAAEPWLGTRWEGSAATIGGHIVNHLGRLPTVDQRFEVDGVDVTVLEMSPKRILWVAVRPLPREPTTEGH